MSNITSDSPGLPFEPEHVEALKARYSAALEYTYDVTMMASGALIHPAEIRSNVFDFKDGLRLTVSVEKLPDDGPTVLHLSAGFMPDSKINEQVKTALHQHGPPGVLRFIRREVPNRWRELSGDTDGSPEFKGVVHTIPHWILPYLPEEGDAEED